MRKIGEIPGGGPIYTPDYELPGGCGCLIIICFLGLIVLNLPFIVTLNQEEWKKNQAIEEGFALEKMEIRENFKVSSNIEDYSIFPGSFSLVYSKQVVRVDNSPIIGMNYFPSETAPHRILMKNLISGKEKAIGIPIESEKESSRIMPLISGNIFSELRNMSLVAPLFSPDGKKIAFASSFTVSGGKGLYIIEQDGSETGRVKEIIPSGKRMGIETVVFGWVSDNDLFVWTCYQINADFFNPFVYAKGRVYLINVNSVKEGRKDHFYFAEIERPGYVPTRPTRVKYVTNGFVKLITESLFSTTEEIVARILVREYKFRKKNQEDIKSPSKTIGKIRIKKGGIDHHWPGSTSRHYAEDLLSNRSPENLHYESKLANWIQQNPQFVTANFRSALDGVMLVSSRKQDVPLELTVKDHFKKENTVKVAAYVGHGDRRKKLCYAFIFYSSDNGESWKVQHRMPAYKIGHLNIFGFLKFLQAED